MHVKLKLLSFKVHHGFFFLNFLVFWLQFYSCSMVLRYRKLLVDVLLEDGPCQQ